MLEHVIQVGPMPALAGLVSGWTAEAVLRARGYGLVRDMALGFIGSVLVSGIVWVVSRDPGMLGIFAVGCVGAGLAGVAQRSLGRSTRLGT